MKFVSRWFRRHVIEDSIEQEQRLAEASERPNLPSGVRDVLAAEAAIARRRAEVARLEDEWAESMSSAEALPESEGR